MNRRDFLTTTGAFSGILATGALSAFAGEPERETQAAPKEDPLVLTDKRTLQLVAQVAEDAGECRRRGELCIQHCLEELSQGHTEMNHCVFASTQMELVCSTIQKLAHLKSVRLKDFVNGCLNACKECREACRPHIGHHKICKDCFDSCERCIKSCTELKTHFGV